MKAPNAIAEQLLRLKTKTGWTWARMTSELERVMGEPGFSASSVFRYAKGKSVPSSALYQRYLREAVRRLTLEPAHRELGEDVPRPSSPEVTK